MSCGTGEAGTALGARVLIIPRLWVRAPPAPPGLALSADSSTINGAIVVAMGRWRIPERGRHPVHGLLRELGDDVAVGAEREAALRVTERLLHPTRTGTLCCSSAFHAFQSAPGSIGRPFGCANTRPWSSRALPAARRASSCVARWARSDVATDARSGPPTPEARARRDPDHRRGAVTHLPSR
jgi:hypothetical protein